MAKNAIVLLSGGLDSTTTLAIAKEQGYKPHCITFDYGQKHVAELKAAQEVKQLIDKEAEHKIIKIDLKIFGKSALTADNIEVPKRDLKDKTQKSVPITYVPARNTIFLSYALAYAEVLPANDIFIGANVIDYSGYPDCRPAYIEAYNIMANLALNNTSGEKIKIHAPLLQLNKSQIIEEGLRLGVDYSMTISCYDPSQDRFSCGRCDACYLRLNAFKKLGKKDPIKYQK